MLFASVVPSIGMRVPTEPLNDRSSHSAATPIVGRRDGSKCKREANELCSLSSLLLPAMGALLLLLLALPILLVLARTALPNLPTETPLPNATPIGKVPPFSPSRADHRGERDGAWRAAGDPAAAAVAAADAAATDAAVDALARAQPAPVLFVPLRANHLPTASPPTEMGATDAASCGETGGPLRPSAARLAEDAARLAAFVEFEVRSGSLAPRCSPLLAIVVPPSATVPG